MLTIKNATLVMKDYFIPDGVVCVDSGRIVNLGPAREVEIPAGEVMDAGGAFVGPGLIDIHTHSAGSHNFFEEPEAAAKLVLEHGVTAVMPALYFNMSKAEYIAAIKLIDSARGSGRADNIIGYYMEGPYLNPNYGCDRERNHWKGPIRREDYAEIIDMTKDSARVWALAPEREGVMDFVRDVKAAIPNIIFTVAHSEATPEQIEDIMPYGLKLATHHTNATGTIIKYPECRGVCVDETVNFNDEIYAEVICDMRGIHVDPYMLRLIRKIKGRDKVILISDACVFDGPIPPGYDGVTDINFDDMGEIAGSKLTLDVACRNMMNHTGGSLVDAFAYASLNPAKLLGEAERGQLRKGNIADLVITDSWMNIKNVFMKGELKI